MPLSTEFTNKIAENYEKYMGPLFFVPFAKDIAGRVQHNVKSILEIACGTGQVTRPLRERFPEAKITASDLNPGMIETAKKLMGEQDKIEWSIADAQNLQFGDNTFEAVICQFGLMFVPDKQKAVNEAYRVLKQGGRFIFNTWDKIDNNLINKIANDVTNSFFADNPITFWDIPFSMYDPAELKKLMSGAGFKNVSAQNIILTGNSPSAREAATGLTSGTPVYSYLAERNENLIPEILDKVTEAIAAEFGEKNLQVPLSAWVAEGLK